MTRIYLLLSCIIFCKNQFVSSNCTKIHQLIAFIHSYNITGGNERCDQPEPNAKCNISYRIFERSSPENDVIAAPINEDGDSDARLVVNITNNFNNVLIIVQLLEMELVPNKTQIRPQFLMFRNRPTNIQFGPNVTGAWNDTIDVNISTLQHNKKNAFGRNITSLWQKTGDSVEMTYTVEIILQKENCSGISSTIVESTGGTTLEYSSTLSVNTTSTSSNATYKTTKSNDQGNVIELALKDEATNASDDVVQADKDKVGEECEALVNLLGCKNCFVRVMNLKRTYLPIKVVIRNKKRDSKSKLATKIEKLIKNFFKIDPHNLRLKSGKNVQVVGMKKPQKNPPENDFGIVVIVLLIIIIVLVIVLLILFVLWLKHRRKTKSEHEKREIQSGFSGVSDFTDLEPIQIQSNTISEPSPFIKSYFKNITISPDPTQTSKTLKTKSSTNQSGSGATNSMNDSTLKSELAVSETRPTGSPESQYPKVLVSKNEPAESKTTKSIEKSSKELNKAEVTKSTAPPSRVASDAHVYQSVKGMR